MTPIEAQATTWPENYDGTCSGEGETCGAYFFYEDHIGRPVMMSEYDDYDSSSSYWVDSSSNPYWQAVYKPFGVFDSANKGCAIVVSNRSSFVVGGGLREDAS